MKRWGGRQDRNEQLNLDDGVPDQGVEQRQKALGGFRCKGEYAHGRLSSDCDSLTSLTTVNQAFQSTVHFNQPYSILFF